MRRSPQYGDGRFVNPVPREALPDGAMAAALRELVFGQQPRRPKGVIPVVKPAFPAKQDGDLHVTWYGHATALVEIEGRRVLIDPVWSDRCSPSPLVGPKRLHPSAGAAERAARGRRDRDLARPLRPPRPGDDPRAHRACRRRRSWCRWASAPTWSAGACPPTGSSSSTGTRRRRWPACGSSPRPARHFSGRGLHRDEHAVGLLGDRGPTAQVVLHRRLRLLRRLRRDRRRARPVRRDADARSAPTATPGRTST